MECKTAKTTHLAEVAVISVQRDGVAHKISGVLQESGWCSQSASRTVHGGQEKGPSK